MTYPFGDTVTILHPTTTGVDEVGLPVREWAEVDVAGVGVAPSDANAAGGNEAMQGGDQVTSGLTLYLPYGTDIDAFDRVRVTGVLYEVDGAPASWRSPLTGTEAGVVAVLRLVTGAN